MLFRLSRLGVFVVLASCLLMIGCRGGNGTVAVEGTVTLDSKPLANATLMFHSADGKGRTASARSNAQGEFKVSSYGEDDGMVPGDYKVVVFSVDPDAKGGNADKMNMAGAQRVAALKDGAVHPNYSNIAKTPLKYTITAKQKLEVALKKEGN